MFCGCELSFGDPPNIHTCPVCLGLPGALPVINARAVDFAIQIGLALGSEIAPRSLFHRKNYFYPDSPKGYQISQYDVPICLRRRARRRSGSTGSTWRRTRPSSSTSGESGRIHGSDRSVVDFNRCGTPLVEIVTEPDLHSAEQAHELLTLLRVTLRQLGVSDVNMDEGSLRCDANVSIRPAGSDKLGTKTELKNMNSFRFLERGVRAEIDRQTAAAATPARRCVQETLHYDPASGRLTSLRSKEEAHDYRYFPEPDLVPLLVTEEMLGPRRARRCRSCRRPARSGSSASWASAPGGPAISPSGGSWPTTSRRRWPPTARPARSRSPTGSRSWSSGSARTPTRRHHACRRRRSPSLAGLVAAKRVSRDAGRDVLTMLVAEGGDPEAIVEREGLQALSSEDDGGGLAEIVARGDRRRPRRGGEGRAAAIMKALGPLVGFVMRETKGRADGGEVTRLILERLGAGLIRN